MRPFDQTCRNRATSEDYEAKMAKAEESCWYPTFPTFPVDLGPDPSSRAYIKDPLVVLYLSSQVPSSAAAGIALPTLSFSLQAPAPLQPHRSSSSVVAFGRRCRRWIRKKERKTGLHFPEDEDLWKYLADKNPSFAASGRRCSSRAPSPRPSPSCAATSIGSARSSSTPSTGSPPPSLAGSRCHREGRVCRLGLISGRASSLLRSSPVHPEAVVGIAAPSRRPSTPPLSPKVAKNTVATMDSISPPSRSRRRPSSVTVRRCVSVACRFRRCKGSRVHRKYSRRLIKDRLLLGKSHRSQTQFL
nr:uncharacterized protein LOC107280941 [Oryza sativa Japonica Group]